MTTRSFVRIDNQIVEKFGNGCIIGPIKLYERQHRVKLPLESIPYVFTGHRRTDALLMQRLLSGDIRFDDLPIVYPSIYS
jgi:hypothetical protein